MSSFLTNRKMMWLSGLGVLLVGVLGFATLQSSGYAAETIVVYKTPTCGCCSKWVTHLEAAGFKVEAHDLNDLSSVKQRFGVTRNLASCHTGVVDGYVIEGHVPAKHIQRLLEERPDVAGLTVPGMPIGSPGMEGPNPEAYDVLSFTKSGKTEVFAHESGS